MATAGSIVIDLLMKTGAFETDVKRAEKRLEEMKRRAIDAGKALGTAIAGGAVIAGTALVAMAKNGIDAADRLDELSQRLGVSTEKLSGLGYAATLTGGNIDTIASALPRLSKAIVEAGDDSSQMGKLFKAMGVDVKDAAGNFRDVEDVLPDVMDAFKSLKDDTLEQALAMQVFGKSGAEMLEFLNLGSEGLAEMEQRAADLGIVVSGETAAAAAEFNDKLGDLKLASQAFATKLASELLPQLTALLDKMAAFVADGDNAKDTADGLTTALSGIATAANIVGDIFQIVGHTLGGVLATASGLLDVMTGIVTLDFSQVEGGLQLMQDGLRGAGRAFFFGEDASGQSFMTDVNGSAPVQKPAADPIFITADSRGVADIQSGMSEREYQAQRRLEAAQKEFAAREKALREALENKGNRSSARSAAPKMSDEQREAERLAEQVEQLNAQQMQRLAMLEEELRTGEEVTELWRVSYELQNGDLAKLSEQDKERIRLNAEREDQLTREIDLAREKRKEEERAQERVDDVLAALREESETLGLSHKDWEIYNRLKQAGVEIDSQLGQQIAQTTSQLYDQREAMNRQIDAMDQFRDAAADSLSEFVLGTKSAEDALKDFFDTMHEYIIRAIAQRWMDQLFGPQGTNGQGSAGGGVVGNWFAALLGNGSGGGNAAASSGGSIWGDLIGQAGASGSASGGGFWAGLFSSFFGGGRAGGGDVMGSRAYLVGENGPEMFVPRTAGTVIPNPDPVSTRHSRAGGMGVVNNFVLGAPTDPRTQAQIANRVGFETQRQMNRSR